MLNRRKLSPNPPAPTSTATSQNRGAADTVPVPEPAVQCAMVTSSDASAATVNCHAVSESASEPSSKRLATIVYRLALSTPPATRRSPAAVPPPPPVATPASTASPPSATTIARRAGRVTVSRSSTAASRTTSADSRPLITAPCTALVRERPNVSPRYASAGSSSPSTAGSHHEFGGGETRTSRATHRTPAPARSSMLRRVTGSKPPRAYFVPLTATPHNPAAPTRATAGRRSHGTGAGTALRIPTPPPDRRIDRCDRKQGGAQRESGAAPPYFRPVSPDLPGGGDVRLS